MSFTSDLQKFSQKTGIRFDQVVRKVCIDVTSDLVKATPVDTGMARSNWFFGYGRNLSTGTDASKNGSPSIQRSQEFASTLKGGGEFFITNNLPYIMRLEFGYSTQAPAGMARKTVNRWQIIVNKIAREVAK